MSAQAATASGGLTLVIRGRPYPVLLPKLSDPRLHLAAVITSLQVIGQIGFHFRLSIAQILVSLATCAVLEVAIAAWRQRVILWPASALLTGNGVAFILRVPGTQHGDWWSLRGWWIFVATAGVSLLSKYLIKWRGAHIFNPSNFGLVLCFLALGRGRADPLDFWWGPMSAWLGLAFVIILAGGFAILGRLKLLWIAVAFWLSFAAGIGVLAAGGHAMTARWHLGPIVGWNFWWVLLSSPEVLVFLFFMITDPKTAPKGPTARIVYAVSVGLLGALLIAPARTEFASKVGLLCALAIVCLARPLLALVPRPQLDRRRVVLAVTTVLAACGATLAATNSGGIASVAPVPVAGRLPVISIEPSRGVQTQLTMPDARVIARDLVFAQGIETKPGERLHVWLEPGKGQAPPNAVAQLAGVTYKLHRVGGHWVVGTGNAPQPVVAANVPTVGGFNLVDVAAQVGLNFRQGAFRYGIANEPAAMMGGGLCWLDYNNDGWMDLFVVNSYTDDNNAAWEEHGGLPTSALFENDHGHFVNVTKKSGAGLPLKGEGCVAADFDGDGFTDLYITTGTDDALLWNNGDGTFTEGARKAGVISFGWHSAAAVSDVNGDGRPDLFVAGYADMHHPIPSSLDGFPTNYPGVRDELFLNDGHRKFKDVAKEVGLDQPPYHHSLGAVFVDVNGDGRPDLFIANDEDPNQLFLNEPGGPLGFHFVNASNLLTGARPAAGMGVAAAYPTDHWKPDLFVTNSRKQTETAYTSTAGASYNNTGAAFTKALGGTFAGWGDSWIDLANSGKLDLVVASGAIPVTNLATNSGPIRVLAQQADGSFVEANVLQKLRTNGRGLAAADFDNDGKVDIAVNSIGGPLILLRNETPAGHWLEVNVKPFSPGAVVTAVLPDGRRLVRPVQAGSSYLSSEDPRVHFGLGQAKSVKLIVRYPDGTVKQIEHLRANQIVSVQR